MANIKWALVAAVSSVLLLCAFVMVAPRLPTAFLPFVLAIFAPLSVGYVVHLVTAYTERARNTRLLYALLEDQIEENRSILTRITRSLEPPVVEAGGTAQITLPSVRPYLPLWDILAALGGKHYLSERLFVAVNRLRRKLDYVSSILDELHDYIMPKQGTEWNAVHANTTANLAKLIRQLADEALDMISQMKVPDHPRRKREMLVHLWPVPVVPLVALCLLVLPQMGRTQKQAAPSAMSPTEAVRAQRFEMVDGAGKVRGALAVIRDAPTLSLNDEKGNTRAMLTVLPDGNPSLSLYNDKGALRGALMVIRDGSPGLALYDEKGKVRGALSVDSDGSPCLAFADENAKTRAVLGATRLVTIRTGAKEKTAESSLVLFDKEGKVLWQAP